MIRILYIFNLKMCVTVLSVTLHLKVVNLSIYIIVRERDGMKSNSLIIYVCTVYHVVSIARVRLIRPILFNYV